MTQGRPQNIRSENFLLALGAACSFLITKRSFSYQNAVAMDAVVFCYRSRILLCILIRCLFFPRKTASELPGSELPKGKITMVIAIHYGEGSEDAVFLGKFGSKLA